MAAVLNGVLYTGSLGNPSTVSDTLMGEKEKAREELCPKVGDGLIRRRFEVA